MPKVHEKLDALAEELAAKGDDAQRLELVQRARRFKRSWLEMAEALLYVRDSRAYERWGYSDLHEYCQKELAIKPSTVDKLTGTYSALREHAPEVLRRDGVGQSIPPMDAVEYFAQAVRPANGERLLPSREVVDELRQAVFDDHKPVAVLRREFGPVLFPKPDGADALERMEKASAAAKRLTALLPTLDGLTPRVRERCVSAIGDLLDELDELVPEKRERLYPTQAAS